MPTEIQSPTVWGRLADKFRLTGRHKLLLDEVIVPVVLVEDLSSEVADTENDATLTIFMPGAGAGLLEAALLQNIGATGVNLIVDKITVSSSAVALITIHQTTLAAILPIGGATIEKTWNDPSQAGAPAGTGFANEGALFGASLEVWNAWIPAQEPAVIEPKQIIPPGHQLVVRSGAQNQELRVTFNYRVVSR